MRVTLFGTRGSLAAPGAETSRFGGNTSSVEVRGSDGTVLVLDAGTGIRKLAVQIPSSIGRIDILLTHLHMDHIQGLGFFGPLYDPRIDVHIWGPASSTFPLEARLSRYLSPPLFPVHLRDLPRVFCHRLPRLPFDIRSFQIQTSLVCHPGPTLGYRIQSEGAVATYLPDHEPILTVRDHQWREQDWISGYDLAAGADLLIHDAQYTDEEYQQRVGWGHSSFRHAFEFAAAVDAKNLVPFHHDPSPHDEMLDDLLERAERQFQPAFKVTPGHEGVVFELGSK